MQSVWVEQMLINVQNGSSAGDTAYRVFQPTVRLVASLHFLMDDATQRRSEDFFFTLALGMLSNECDSLTDQIVVRAQNNAG